MLSKEQVEQMEAMLSTPPTVDIKIDLRGDLYIDGRKIVTGFATKLGPEHLKVEVEMLRAITKAEERATERFIEKLEKMGIKIPASRPV